jgi:hypothetical protein
MAEGSVKPAHAVAGTHKTDGECHLAAGGTWQELTQRYNIGIGFFIEPAAAHDELLAIVAEMGKGSAEARDTELQKGQQDFNWRARGTIHAHRIGDGARRDLRVLARMIDTHRRGLPYAYWKSAMNPKSMCNCW